MKQKLEENKGIPASLLWILAIISGLSVANLYYNQPLLNRISEDLGISEFTANLIPMTTQIGYALGLLFIIPLGDLYKRKNIIVINFLLLSVATCSIAMSVNVFYILLASLVTGICSVMPQIFIPIAAQFSLPQNKARNVGMMRLSQNETAFFVFAKKIGQVLTSLSQNLPVSLIFCILGNQVKISQR